MGQIIELINKLSKNELPYPPRITKYELARVVAARAKQLAMGAQPLVNPQEVGSYDPIDIALEEARRGLLPLVIIRTLPNGKRVRIRYKDLIKLTRDFGVNL
nr:DNA-directed RNA polymerase subunit K [Vulcanisaeta thermophila]